MFLNISNIKKFIITNFYKFSEFYDNKEDYLYILQSYKFNDYNNKNIFFNFIKTENYNYYLNQNILIIPVCYIKNNKKNIVCQIFNLNDLNNIFININFKLFSNNDLNKFKLLKIKYPKAKINYNKNNNLFNYLNFNIFNKNFKEFYSNYNFINILYTHEKIINTLNELKIKTIKKTKNSISIIIPICNVLIDNKINGISCFEITFFNQDWNLLINKNINVLYKCKKILF